MPEEKSSPSVTFEPTGDIKEQGEKAGRDMARQLGEEAKAKAGFEIPKDLVKLPSAGKIYPSSSPLYKIQEIEVRQMTAADEDILTSRALIRSGKAIDMVIQNCLVDKSINLDDLLLGDKNRLMISLRTSSYGADYNIKVSCPSCAEESDFEADLAKLTVNNLELEPTAEGVNSFAFEVPSGRIIEFKFMTSGDQHKISEAQANLKKATNSQADNNITSRLMNQILSVDGNSDVVGEYVRNMTARDSRALRKYIDDNEPDVIMKQSFECSACGVSQEVDLPLTVTFFWPE